VHEKPFRQLDDSTLGGDGQQNVRTCTALLLLLLLPRQPVVGAIPASAAPPAGRPVAATLGEAGGCSAGAAGLMDVSGGGSCGIMTHPIA
jgi:hypothetical protein